MVMIIEELGHAKALRRVGEVLACAVVSKVDHLARGLAVRQRAVLRVADEARQADSRQGAGRFSPLLRFLA